LAGFGALAAAKHPVLRDLGMVVSLGAGMSLAFALFVRFLPEVRDAP
jgi:predicted RND superfamily exporter protein